jgi:hypothetical protein
MQAVNPVGLRSAFKKHMLGFGMSLDMLTVDDGHC